jgi:DNA-binding NarL/FixJ family response regulator
MCPYRIVLADDHTIVREGIRRLIMEMADLEVVGEVGDGLELLRLLEKSTADLVVLDISMPNLRGIEATREIKSILPHVRILILTMYQDRELLYHAIAAGADGFMLKKDSGTELSSAIKKIQQGGVYISPSLSEELIEDWVQSCRENPEPPSDPLTNREREVLKLIAEGKSNKAVADLLFISVHTVETHRLNIMKKLGLKKTADLVKYAIRKGYTEVHN